MSFSEAIVSGLRNYFKFSGRAPRSEFWYFILFCVLVGIGTMIPDFFLFRSLFDQGIGPFYAVASLALLVPGIAVSVRRLHDIDRTGWWYLIAFTLVGGLLLIVWALKKGTAGKNRFGADPLARA